MCDFHKCSFWQRKERRSKFYDCLDQTDMHGISMWAANVAVGLVLEEGNTVWFFLETLADKKIDPHFSK